MRHVLAEGGAIGKAIVGFGGPPLELRPLAGTGEVNDKPLVSRRPPGFASFNPGYFCLRHDPSTHVRGTP